MKFKTIFFLFNAIILLSILFFILMPVFLLGGDGLPLFWQNTWYFFLVFVIVLLVFDVFFLMNWKLYQLLEKENWEELYHYLRNLILVKKKLSRRNTRLYVNCCVLASKGEKIADIADILKQEKPQLHQQLSVNFAIPLLLEKDYQKAEQYYLDWKDKTLPQLRAWHLWAAGLCQMMSRKVDEAWNNFYQASQDEKASPLVALISIFLAEILPVSTKEAETEKIDQQREELAKQYYSPALWEKQIKKEKEGNLLITLFYGKIQEAVEWLLEGPAGENDSQIKETE